MDNNNTMAAGFTAWLATRQHHGLPWQTDSNELREAFTAGYNAAPNAAIAQSVESRDIQAGDAGSSPAGSSITAEDVYAAYPRKVGKQAALKAIQKAVKAMSGKAIPAELMRELFKSHPLGATITGWDYLLNRTKAYASATARWPAADKKYIPHPATWYNRGSYDDDPKEWERGNPATMSQFSRTH